MPCLPCPWTDKLSPVPWTSLQLAPSQLDNSCVVAHTFHSYDDEVNNPVRVLSGKTLAFLERGLSGAFYGCRRPLRGPFRGF